MRSLLVALIVGALLATGALALASGGQPPVDRGYPPPGVTAIGIGTATVSAPGRKTQGTISRAVEQANAKARPRSFADAKRRAQAMAALAGLRLGAVWSVGQEPNIPWYGASINQGTFGGNDFCGPERRFAGYRTTATGRRVRRYKQRFTCRAPKEVTIYLSVTFAQAS